MSCPFMSLALPESSDKAQRLKRCDAKAFHSDECIVILCQFYAALGQLHPFCFMCSYCHLCTMQLVCVRTSRTVEHHWGLMV